jgi:hypothetical protein
MASAGKVKGSPPGTDVLGAMDYAAFLSERNTAGRQVRVMVFTDFQDDVPADKSGGRSQTGHFPPGTQLAGFFVVNKENENMQQWQKRIEKWAATLNQMGAQCDAKSFHQPGEAADPSTVQTMLQNFLRPSVTPPAGQPAK